MLSSVYRLKRHVKILHGRVETHNVIDSPLVGGFADQHILGEKRAAAGRALGGQTGVENAAGAKGDDVFGQLNRLGNDLDGNAEFV